MRSKTVMKFAHVFVVLVALLISVFLCIGDKESNSLLYNIGANGFLAILIGFTVVWGWTLFKLYRDTKNSEKLLPAKKTFIVHGSLLFLFRFLFWACSWSSLLSMSTQVLDNSSQYPTGCLVWLILVFSSSTSLRRTIPGCRKYFVLKVKFH